MHFRKSIVVRSLVPGVWSTVFYQCFWVCLFFVFHLYYPIHSSFLVSTGPAPVHLSLEEDCSAWQYFKP